MSRERARRRAEREAEAAARAAERRLREERAARRAQWRGRLLAPFRAVTDAVGLTGGPRGRVQGRLAEKRRRRTGAVLAGGSAVVVLAGAITRDWAAVALTGVVVVLAAPVAYTLFFRR
ncbi:hypothetical protein [Nocardioides sp. GY 10127]|uniref:hypothetical protein n=1 Tax=Nocardioides sp. GY 10127 TaxID=2569762 RepID=UPI0010A75CF3|nr:hypothetical protein [Nocardioides sp. GY 10127]TIC80999.1 hypothetical protein E8D37_14345 [Nocardioides sp. GY 10127]